MSRTLALCIVQQVRAVAVPDRTLATPARELCRRHRIADIGMPHKNGKSTLAAALALYRPHAIEEARPSRDEPQMHGLTGATRWPLPASCRSPVLDPRTVPVT